MKYQKKLTEGSSIIFVVGLCIFIVVPLIIIGSLANQFYQNDDIAQSLALGRFCNNLPMHKDSLVTSTIAFVLVLGKYGIK